MNYDDTARLKEQVGLLISALGSNQPATIHIAEAQLSLIGKTAVPFLLSALQNAHAEIEDLNKERKEHGSDTYGGGQRRPELEGIIKGIIKTLGIIGDQGTVSILAQELPDLDAIEALSKIASEEALKAIIDCIPKFKSWGDGYHPVEETGYLSQESKDFLASIFSRLGEDGLKALIVASQKDSPNKSRFQIVLSLIGGKEEIPMLIEMLRMENLAVFSFAVRKLWELKAKSAAPVLKEFILKYDAKDSEKQSTHYKEMRARVYNQTLGSILELGTLEDWLNIRFSRKRDHSVIEILEPAILKSGENAVPYLKRMIDDPDKEKQELALEMIKDIREGKTEQRRVIRY